MRARFLARHPKARLYADFPAFSFWRLEVAGSHLNGGFARATALSAAELLTDLAGAEALLAAEADVLDHMNQDHPETLRLYATRLVGAENAAWLAVGLDPDSLDLSAGDRTARVPVPHRVTDPGMLRRVLKDLADAAPRAAPSPIPENGEASPRERVDGDA